MSAQYEDRDVLTPQEVARRLGIGKNAAYQMLAAGAIPHIRFGWKYLIPRSAFEEWLHTAHGIAPTVPSVAPASDRGTRGRRAA